MKNEPVLIPLEYHHPRPNPKKIIGITMGWFSLACWLWLIWDMRPTFRDATASDIFLIAATYGVTVGTGIHGLRFGSGLSRCAAALSLIFAILLGILIALSAWERRQLIIYYWTDRWY